METTVAAEALPLYLEGTANKAVLIIHGYTGITGDFFPLARQLNDRGYTVSLPRLPGHGTNRKDFMTTGARDWILHAEESYRDLRARYEDVSIIGLSMGGVIALLLSARYSPRKTVLMAPAMAVRNKMFYLTPYLGRFLGPMKAEWQPEPDATESMIFLGSEYWAVDIPSQAAQLRKVQKIAARELSRIGNPLLIMVSETDETVPPEAAQVIKKGLPPECPVETVLLHDSHHVLVTGNEKDMVLEKAVSWLEEA
jgi:carboxylesterase